MSDHDAGPSDGKSRRKVARVARRLARRAVRPAARRVVHGTPLRRFVRPTVSIILPFYNVETYIAECLDSIDGQIFTDYEVIAVDDGSPDGSAAIVREYAGRDRRIRVVEQQNKGLGGARNTGVRLARGRYLTFVDSDDVLPPTALQALVTSAERTGSDIVVGSILRFDSKRDWRPSWTARVHGTRRERIRVEQFLPLLRNLYTWDKLFRRDFYLREGLAFREGVHYEDQPVITQLLARAGSIDVIPELVYHYRARDDRSSISQQTATVADLDQRIDAWRTSREVLVREVSPTVYRGWLQTLFDSHFHWYLTSPGTADDEYWHKLREVVLELTDGAPQELWDATPPEKRVLIQLTRMGRREDAQEFVRVNAAQRHLWPTRIRPDGVLLELPMHDDPALDSQLFLLRPDQLELTHAIENIHWIHEQGGRTLCRISGWAYVDKVDLAHNEQQVAVLLRGPDGQLHRFAASDHPSVAFPPPSQDTWCDYLPGSFLADLPLHEVIGAAGSDRPWEVFLEVTVAGFTVTQPVVSLLRSGAAGVIPAADLGDEALLVADWMFGTPLRFRLQRVQARVDEVAMEGRCLVGRLHGPTGDGVEAVAASTGRVRVEAKVRPTKDGSRAFRLVLPPAPALGDEGPTTWNVTGRGTHDSPVSLTAQGEMGVLATFTTADGVFTVERTRNSELSVVEWSTGVVAEELEVLSEGVLKVTGRTLGRQVMAVELTTRHKKCRADGARALVVEGRFQAEVELRHQLYRYGPHALPRGEHDLHARVYREDDQEPVEVPVKVSAGLSSDLPVLVQTQHNEGRVVRGPANGVRLSLIRPIGDAAGRYRQNQLRLAPPSGKLHRGVLMRAYFGEYATDHGLSVQRELQRRGSDLPVYWAVQDYSVPVPEGGVPVVVNSREYYRLLSSVKYYLDNMYQPEFHSKPDGQVMVQTFHGYPFKLMGHAHWENLRFSRARIRSYDRRAADWDYLVSPARYATPLLVEHFRYAGEVLEIGYPRNDVLLSPDADKIRRLTRESLGLREDQVAVLYAPTFRDYLSADDNSAAMANFLDFAEVHRQLGEEFVILVRGHAFNARANERVGALPGTIDLTDYPEVSDLYLAADAAIVDYSSLRFDFGITGKPLLFHVPDLARYHASRGWLFDFEPTAPGPLLETTEDVVAALLDLDGVRNRYRQQYDSFRRDYLDLDDGHAGRRLVERVFAGRGDA